MIMRPELVTQLRSELPRMQVEKVGPGMHYLQETQPTAIGKEVGKWAGTLPPWKGEPTVAP